MIERIIPTTAHDYNGRSIRTADYAGGVWWVLADICAVIGITPKHASRVSRHLDEADRALVKIRVNATDTRANIVSTEGICAYLDAVARDGADKLRDWIRTKTRATAGDTPGTAPEPVATPLPTGDAAAQPLHPTLFQFDDVPVRAVEIDGEVWLVLRDVCQALELRNSRDVRQRLECDETCVGTIYIGNTTRRATLINEAGLYDAVLISRKPKAREFRHWITHEVVPAILHTGTYCSKESRQPSASLVVSDEMADQLLSDPRFLQRLIARLQAVQDENVQLRRAIHQSPPPVPPSASLPPGTPTAPPGSGGLLNISEIAKSLGTTGTVLNEALHNLGIQYKARGTWYLYAAHEGKGYTRTIMQPYQARDETRIRPHTRWTPKGYRFICSVLRANNLLDENGCFRAVPYTQLSLPL